MHRYKIVVEYDGTNFFGWQRQKNVDTIQQRLEESVIPLTKNIAIMHGAGRTDTGVHALGQVAHFDCEFALDPFCIQQCMNAHLRDVAISVIFVEEITKDFDARFSAVERFYLYRILNRRAKPAIDLNKCWWIMYDLDVVKMHDVAQCLVGNHDFSAFRAVGCQAKSPIKTLNAISVVKKNVAENFNEFDIQNAGTIIEIYVSAPSFLYHQVRNIVGSLLMVGSGKWSTDQFQNVFMRKDRTQAGQTAPACGLFFTKVLYNKFS